MDVLSHEFENKFIDVQPFIGCGLLTTLIPNINWNQKRNSISSSEEEIIVDLFPVEIINQLTKFHYFFDQEISFLFKNFNDVQIKFAWINYIIEL